MDKNDTQKSEARRRRPYRGESAIDAVQFDEATSDPTPDAVESAPSAEPTAPESESREAWKHRRAIALGLIKP